LYKFHNGMYHNSIGINSKREGVDLGIIPEFILTISILMDHCEESFKTLFCHNKTDLLQIDPWSNFWRSVHVSPFYQLSETKYSLIILLRRKQANEHLCNFCACVLYGFIDTAAAME